MTATGTYINEYDDWYDVFVILNEPNDAPSFDEVDQISEAIKYHVSQVYVSAESLKKALDLYLAQLNLNCLEYGYQIIVKNYEVAKLYDEKRP